MIDITLIREDLDGVRAAILRLNDPGALVHVDAAHQLDIRRRELRAAVEAMQSERNDLNRAMGKVRGDRQLTDAAKAARFVAAAGGVAAGDAQGATALLAGSAPAGETAATLDEAFETLVAELKAMGDRIDDGFATIKAVEAELDEHMLWIPNLPHESVPVADGEEGNVPHPPVGLMQEFDFAPKAHWELGAQLGIIDIERGVKLSGSRFYILRGLGARLQRALIAFFLDHAREAGFIEAYVPYLVTEPMLYGASQFPKFRDVVYSDPDAGLFLLPTAEVALTNMYRDEVIDEDALPLYFVAQSPCFRHEKAAAGKDTRGIKRVHQFEKVEMYKFTTPETSYDELESLTRTAESLCDQLGLYHRRLEIATGDLGFSATKKYDVEVWAPGSEEWLEVSSCSNTEAFQARRAMIRYRPRGAKNTRYVHTLNGSGLGLPRTIIAILETYQQADGSVRVPPVLVPYLGGAEVIEPV